MKIYFIIFFIFLTLVNIFAQQEVVISTTIANPDEENYQISPLYYKFYYIPDFFGTPSVDYDDISIPYSHYITPELNKATLENTLFIPKNISEKNVYFEVGKNYILNSNIKFISSFYSLSSFLEVNNSQINYLNLAESLKQLNYYFNYYKTFKNLYIDFQMLTHINYFIEFMNLYTTQLNVKNFIKDKLETSYAGAILYVKNTYGKIFSFNTISLNALLNSKLLIGAKIKLIDNDGLLYTFNLISKEVFPRFATSIDISYDNFNKNIYYNFSFTQNIFNLLFKVSYDNDIYYDYIQNYFSKIPILKLNNPDIFFYPERKILGLGVGYQKDVFSLQLNVSHAEYKKYPTYIYENNNVSPFYLESLNFNNLDLSTNIGIQNVNVNWVNSLIFSEEEILFQPKVSSSLDVISNIYKNVYLSIKLLYNSKTKVDFNNTWIKQILILRPVLKYEIMDDLKLYFNFSLPLIGKYYFIPYAFFGPYVSFGIEMKF